MAQARVCTDIDFDRPTLIGKSMFIGINAFPLTPLRKDSLDEATFARLIESLASAGVDSITALGSTGSHMYLDRDEWRRTATLVVQHAGNIPVMVGTGALRTSQVQRLADDAQEAGAGAVLLAPVTYQPLGDDEVFGLFEAVTADLSVPLVVYDNPGTTHVNFSNDLYARIASLPQVASIKIPPSRQIPLRHLLASRKSASTCPPR